MRWSADRLAAKGRGATFKQVNRSDIGGMEIALTDVRTFKRVR
jgi:hypothetical protein